MQNKVTKTNRKKTLQFFSHDDSISKVDDNDVMQE
jgi:hypothetical protein